MDEQKMAKAVDNLESQVKLTKLDSGDEFESFYASICDQIRANNTLDRIMEEFQKCEDDQSRICYMFDFLGSNVPNVKECPSSKEEEEAQASEDSYDILIAEERNTRKALEVIQTSICKTPFSELNSLKRRYMKRGWASLMCANFKDAETDARRSLSKPSPQSSFWNAHEILGHCHVKMEKYKEAEEYFMEALDGLKKSDSSNVTKASVAVRISSVLKTIKEEMKPKSEVKRSNKKQQGINKNKRQSSSGNSKQNKSESKIKSKLPKVFNGRHSKLTNASSALKVVYREGVGRCVVANRDIPTGSIVMVDDPYAAVVNKDQIHLRCNHCMQRTSSGIPCQRCSLVQYCNSECEEAGSDLHSYECPVMHKIYDSAMGKMAPLVFRILATASWSALRQVKERLTEEQKKEDRKPTRSPKDPSNESVTDTKWIWDGSYSHTNYLSSFYLVTNSTERSFGDMFKRTVSAVYISSCLKAARFFGSDPVSEDDFQFLSSLALRHFQNTSCNAYEISESLVASSCPPYGKSLEVGGAIYPTISLTNHSCFPNVARYNIENSCVLRTTRYIPKGCEVLDNYGYYFHSLSSLDRKEALQTQYKFECSCVACSQDWPVYSHLPAEPIIFKCPKCKANSFYGEERTDTCLECSESLTQVLQEISVRMESYSSSLSLIHYDKHEEALTLLIKLQEFFEPIACYPAKYFTDIQELIRHCYNSLGNVVTK